MLQRGQLPLALFHLCPTSVPKSQSSSNSLVLQYNGPESVGTCRCLHILCSHHVHRATELPGFHYTAPLLMRQESTFTHDRGSVSVTDRQFVYEEQLFSSAINQRRVCYCKSWFNSQINTWSRTLWITCHNHVLMCSLQMQCHDTSHPCSSLRSRGFESEVLKLATSVHIPAETYVKLQNKYQ